MPRYEVTAPDGRRFEITAPEGATQEQVLSYAQQQFAQQPQEGQNVPQDAPDLTRGISNIIPQIKSAYYGAKVLAAKAVDDKEMLAQAAKDYGEVSKQTASKESDSFTKAWEMGIGTVVGDWLPYQIGSGVGSLLETLASMGIGAAAGMGVGSIPGAVSGAVGKTLLKKGIKEEAERIIKEGIAKEAIKKGAKEEAEQAAQALIQKEAKKALRNFGAEAGIASQSAIHGAGEVTGRAVEELEKEGKTAEDIDMSRVVPAAVVHAVADFVSDKIAVGALKGLSGKSTESFIKDVTKAIGITGLKETPPETIQTIAERYGANLSLNDAEALKEYIDTVAASFGMSVVPGGVGGVRTYMSGKVTEDNKKKQDEIKDTGGSTTETEAETIVNDPDAQIDPNLEADLAPSIIAGDNNATAQTETATKDVGAPAAPPAAPPVQEDAELAAMKKEYADRQAKIDAGGPPKQIKERTRANAELAEKIKAKEAELAAAQPPAPPVQPPTEPPTQPPAQFDAAAFQKKLQGMTDEQIQEDYEVGFWGYTDEELALLKDEYARRKAAGAITQPPAAPVAQPPAAPRTQVGPNADSFVNINAQQSRDIADKRGITSRIEDEFATGKTARQVRDALEKDLDFLPPEERENFVVQVRATLGIPSRATTEGKAEFDAWKKDYDVRKQPPAPPVAQPPAEKPTTKPKRAKAKTTDQVIKLGYLEQPSYYGERAPADTNEGIVYAGREEGFDLFDTVDYEKGVVPEIKNRAKEENVRREEENKRRAEKRQEIIDRLKKQGYSPKQIKDYLAGVENLGKLKKLDLKSLNPLEFMSENELIGIYRRHAGKKEIGRDADIRKAYAAKRKEFIDSLTPMQQLGIKTNTEAAFRQEVLGSETRGADRSRRRMTETEKALRDIKQQLAQEVKTDEQIAAEETEAERLALEEEKKQQTVQAEVAAETAAQQDKKNPTRRKITINIENAVNETGNVVDVLGEILNDRANDSITRVIAKGLGKLLQQIGAIGINQKTKEGYDYITAKIVFGDLPSGKDGRFDPATNTITLRGANGQYTGQRKLDQVVLHEVMHYLTDHVFSNKKAYLASIKDADLRRKVEAAMNRLGNNYRYVKGKLGNKYNIGTMKEFIAEMYSNPNLQIDIANLPPIENQNVFSRITNSIAQALGFRSEGEAVTLRQIMDDIAMIVSLPTPEMRGKSVSYATTVPPPTPTPKQTTRKQAGDMKPSRDEGLNDHTDNYKTAAYQRKKTFADYYRLVKQVPFWRNVATRFQNSRFPIKRWQDVLDMADKIYYEGKDKLNNIYTQIVRSTGLAKNYYHAYIKPLQQKLDSQFLEFAKAANKSTDEALGIIHRLLEALHEPERRRVKFILTVPLSTDASLGLTQNGKPISAADRRAKIVELLDTRTLTDAQAKQLRQELDTIVDAKRPDGKYLFRDANGFSPRPIPKPKNAQQAAEMIDQNNVLYNVIGLGSEKETAQQVVDKRLKEYASHPQKAEIDRILSTLREFNGPNGVTAQLSKYSNYWSDFVSNRVAFYDFQNYAPFKGQSKFDKQSEVDEILDFDDRRMGRELQEAAYAMDGRVTPADNPMLTTMQDAILAALRAGRKDLTLSIKNAITQGLLGPQSKVKDTISFKDRTNPEVINKYKGDNYIFHYNENGTVDILYVHDKHLRDAIRRSYQVTKPFTEMMSSVTSFLGKTHTRWNLDFAPLNFVRDVLTNIWAVGADMGPREALRFATQVATEITTKGAFPKAWKVAALFQDGAFTPLGDINKSTKAGKELDKLAASDPTIRDMVEFIKEGGMVSYLQGISIKSNFEELHKQLGRSGIMRNAEQVNKFLDMWVEMFELVSRASAYKIAKQKAKQKLIADGVSDKPGPNGEPSLAEKEARTRGAFYTKELANFELVGDWGRTMGALFMFFRPSATGAVRAIESAAPAFRRLKEVELELPPEVRNDEAARKAYMEKYAEKQKNARYMVTSLFGMGMMAYIMSAMMSDDDDLGRNETLNDNMIQWTRSARFHIPKSITEAMGIKEPVTFQIPWGFGLGAFAAAGAQFASVVFGKQTPQEAMANVALQISLDSFVPIPVSRMSPTDNGLAFFIDSITPSSLRPLVEFVMNKNGLGQDIYNDANRRMGDAFIGGDKIPEVYKNLAAAFAVNTLGVVDVSPNSLYFFANSYLDGISRIFEIGTGLTDVASGQKDFNPKTDLALFRSFFGARSSVDVREFQKVSDKVKDFERRINMFENRPEVYADFTAEYPLALDVVQYYNKLTGGPLRKLQSEANEIRLDPNYSPKDKKDLLEINKFAQNLIKRQIVDTAEMYGITPD